MAYIYDEKTGEFKTTGSTRVGGSSSGSGSSSSSGSRSTSSSRSSGSSRGSSTSSSGSSNDGCGGCFDTAFSTIAAIVSFCVKAMVVIIILGVLITMCS